MQELYNFFLDIDFSWFKTSPQHIMPKLGSFIISKAEDLTLIGDYNSVVKTGANLRNMMTPQAVENSRSQNFVRNSPVWEPQATKSHPAKPIKRTVVHQDKCFSLACTDLQKIIELNHLSNHCLL